jgi:DNA-binding NarL/FixJ family response regulator
MRMIIAEDVGLYRDMLCQTLTGAGHEVVGLAGAADEAVALVDRYRPDVVLLDIRMPPTHTDDGLRAALQMRAGHPELAVLLLSSYGEVEYAVRLVEGLAARVGYLIKERTTSAPELLTAIDRVVAGGVLIDPDLIRRLMARSRADDPLRLLSERERETLALMAEGHSNTAIAKQMRIATSTVEKHANAVFRKLHLAPDPGQPAADANSRVRAVLTYLRHTGQIAPRQ